MGQLHTFAPILLILPCCAGEGRNEAEQPRTADAEHSTFRTDGRFIRSPDGRAVILKGVNVGNVYKDPRRKPWVTEPDYRQIAGWGFNVVRLVHVWAGIEPSPGEYDEAYFREIEQRLNWIQSAGLMAVLDMHQDIFGEAFRGDGAPAWACPKEKYASFQYVQPWNANLYAPEVLACWDYFWSTPTIREGFFKAWEEMVRRFSDHPSVIGYDLLNEPGWGAENMAEFHERVLRPFYAELIDRIRALDGEKLIFFEPTILTQTGMGPGWSPLDAKNMVYAPHFYHPLVHEGFPYAGDKDYLARVLASYEKTAVEWDIPWWLGEFGAPIHVRGTDQYLMDMEHIMDDHMVGSAYWSYDRSSGGFAMLSDDGQPKERLLDILSKPYPRFVQSIPLRYRFDYREKEFTIEFVEARGQTAPTEIFLAAGRHYPGGFLVSCEPREPCEYEHDEAAGVLTVPPSGKGASRSVKVASRPR